MIFVKIPRIIFKILNFEFIVCQLYGFQFFLITTIRSKGHIQFLLKKSDFVTERLWIISYSGLHCTYCDNLKQ
jgi:hypothetical protein